LTFGSLPVDSERLDRVSPIKETDSGFGGGVSATGSMAGAGAGATGCLALLIGGTADLRVVLDSECAFFRLGVIRSVACWGWGGGGGGGVATFSAGSSALGFAFWEGSFLLLARVAMNLFF
jgi:hypothetical protein